MRSYEREAWERYKYDYVYHDLVTLLKDVMQKHRISPNEVHDAVNIAASLTRPVYFRVDGE